MFVDGLETGPTNALSRKAHTAHAAIFAFAHDIVTVCQHDKRDRFVVAVQVGGASDGKPEIGIIALPYATRHGHRHFRTDRAVLAQEIGRNVEKVFQRRG